MKPRVLIVDDELFVIRALRRVLTASGFEVVAASSPVEALCVMEEMEVQVVISDERMPGGSGMDFLAWCAEHHPRVGRILLSGFIDRDLLIRSEFQGRVYEALDKPWRNGTLVPTIWSAMAFAALAGSG